MSGKFGLLNTDKKLRKIINKKQRKAKLKLFENMKQKINNQNKKAFNSNEKREKNVQIYVHSKASASKRD